MFRILNKLFGGSPPKKAVLQPEASVIVTFDSEWIRCTKRQSEEESIAWDKLDAVLIETTDEGPLLADVFWLLLTRDMTSGCVFPGGATGEGELLEEMQKRLPGFDNEVLIEAMCSMENKRFLIWERGDS